MLGGMASKNQKKYSTVLIVDKNSGSSKSITVKTTHLERWKTYLMVTVLFVSSLVATLVYFYKQAESNRQAAIDLEIFKREIAGPLSVDTAVARTYIDNIEGKLEKINKYLSQRGVYENVGSSVGGNDNPNVDAINMYKMYDKYLSKVLTNLKATPLGFPYKSELSSSFGYRSDPFKTRGTVFHSGIDIKGQEGDNVRCSAYGKVISAEWNSGYGNCVRVMHKNGYETVYAHMSSIKARKGQEVKAGQVIGTIGSTGHSTGPHLHYEVRLKGKPIDPNKFLKI
jgi:murein DD-endopeptidase MepM/ murein hydrolase activator NlpD